MRPCPCLLPWPTLTECSAASSPSWQSNPQNLTYGLARLSLAPTTTTTGTPSRPPSTRTFSQHLLTMTPPSAYSPHRIVVSVVLPPLTHLPHYPSQPYTSLTSPWYPTPPSPSSQIHRFKYLSPPPRQVLPSATPPQTRTPRRIPPPKTCPAMTSTSLTPPIQSFSLPPSASTHPLSLQRASICTPSVLPAADPAP